MAYLVAMGGGDGRPTITSAAAADRPTGSTDTSLIGEGKIASRGAELEALGGMECESAVSASPETVDPGSVCGKGTFVIHMIAHAVALCKYLKCMG